MMPIPRSISPKVLIACTSISVLPLGMLGCTGSKVAGPRTQSPQRVTLEDFVDHTPQNAHESAQALATHESAYSSPAPQTLDAHPEPLADSMTLTGTPVDSSADSNMNAELDTQPPAISRRPEASGALTLLDAKVGDVNGKPIFTNSFFAPLEDRLIAEAASQPSLQAWRKASVSIIASRLNGMISDELLRAEALAALTPTQRVGLQAFLNNFRNNLLSKNLGSSQLANRRLREEQGQTLDQALKQQEVDTLVQLTLIQEINRRVNVSWRDIQQRYERDIEKYAPPPTAVLRVIRAFKSDTEKVATIQSELDSGTRFLVLAAGPLNNWKTEADGMQRVLIEDTYETTKFFGSDELNKATQQLAVGEAAGPIELGSSVYWIKLMSIEQETLSLYDAQLQIQREIKFERRRAAQEEYLARLMDRAKVSSRDEVLMRLLDIAQERYGPRS